MAGKRANGEGSITKRADGTWEARFSYEDAATGRMKRSSSYGKTSREARDKMREKRERVEAGQPLRDASVLLRDFTATWVATTLAASTRKASTKSTYTTIARVHLAGEEGIGATRLDRLRPTDVEALVLTMRAKGLSPSTIRQTYTILRAILDAAVRDGLVAKNAAAAVARPGLERVEARFLTPAEVAELLDAARGSRYRPLLAFLSLTALRRGEALGLRWADIDVAGGLLRVRGTLGRVDGALTLTEPKTERSRRAVPLSAPVVALLAAQREGQVREREHAGSLWVDSGYVFTTEMGAPVDPRNALRALTTAARKAGLEGVTLHSLRHSAASAMLNGGVPLKAVSDVLGHSSVAITGDIYGHVAPEVQRGALDALAAALA